MHEVGSMRDEEWAVGLDHFRQVVTIDVFHRQDQAPAQSYGRIGSDYVDVLKSSGRLDFAEKTLEHTGPFDQMAGDDLEYFLAAHELVIRKVNHAHPSAPSSRTISQSGWSTISGGSVSGGGEGTNGFGDPSSDDASEGPIRGCLVRCGLGPLQPFQEFIRRQLGDPLPAGIATLQVLADRCRREIIELAKAVSLQDRVGGVEGGSCAHHAISSAGMKIRKPIEHYKEKGRRDAEPATKMRNYFDPDRPCAVSFDASLPWDQRNAFLAGTILSAPRHPQHMTDDMPLWCTEQETGSVSTRGNGCKDSLIDFEAHMANTGRPNREMSASCAWLRRDDRGKPGVLFFGLPTTGSRPVTLFQAPGLLACQRESACLIRRHAAFAPASAAVWARSSSRLMGPSTCRACTPSVAQESSGKVVEKRYNSAPILKEAADYADDDGYNRRVFSFLDPNAGGDETSWCATVS